MKLHFGSFNLFPSSKIDFWSFLKLQKMEFGQKKFVKLIYFQFLAHCAAAEARCDVVLKTTWPFHSPRPSYMQKKNYWMTLLRSFLRSKCWSSTLKNRRSWVAAADAYHSKLFSKTAKIILRRTKKKMHIEMFQDFSFCFSTHCN